MPYIYTTHDNDIYISMCIYLNLCINMSFELYLLLKWGSCNLRKTKFLQTLNGFLFCGRLYTYEIYSK